VALGDDLLLRIDADAASAEAGLDRAKRALDSYQTKMISTAAAAAKLENEIDQAYAAEARAAEVAAAKESAAAEKRTQA
jgi:hypothetical protein